MRFSKLALGLALATPAMGDLSWDYVDQRQAQARDLQQKRAEIERIAAEEEKREPSPEEKAAYQKLGEALANHPEMQEVNRIEREALDNYQHLLENGNNVEISLAAQELAEAKAVRFKKAASIPELKALIEAWQQAALGIKPEVQPSAEEQSALDRIGGMLGELGAKLTE